MNSTALQLLTDGAVFLGEFKRDLIALGGVLLIVLLILAIQTFRER